MMGERGRDCYPILLHNVDREHVQHYLLIPYVPFAARAHRTGGSFIFFVMHCTHTIAATTSLQSILHLHSWPTEFMHRANSLEPAVGPNFTSIPAAKILFPLDKFTLKFQTIDFKRLPCVMSSIYILGINTIL